MGYWNVEDCRAIDVDALAREGFLGADAVGHGGTVTWSRGGEEQASIGFRRTTTSEGEPALRLGYTVAPDTDDAREIMDIVRLVYTEPHFGGRRPWFRCPSQSCHERVGKLYKPPRRDRFRCRHCHDLGYESRERQGEYVYEVIGKPLNALDEAADALDEGAVTHEKLRAVYEAKQRVRSGFDTLLSRPPIGEYDEERERPSVDPLPPFEEWLDDLFHRAYGSPGGREYGFFGRCEATAKTTGERCRQPATGQHGKCYYHGGARATESTDSETVRGD